MVENETVLSPASQNRGNCVYGYSQKKEMEVELESAGVPDLWGCNGSQTCVLQVFAGKRAEAYV